MKCEVIRTIKNHQKRCENIATYKVRHKDHRRNDSFLVCEDHIAGYRYKIDPRAEGSFIVKKIVEVAKNEPNSQDKLSSNGSSEGMGNDAIPDTSQKGCGKIMGRDSFNVNIVCGKYTNLCSSCRAKTKEDGE